MVAVPRLMPSFDATAARTRAVGSSIRLAQPIQAGINHLLGDLKHGLLCWQPQELNPAAGLDMERSFWTHRHPNTDWLHVLVWKGEGDTEGDDQIAVQAGTGTAVSVTCPWNEPGWLEFLAPWGSADSGYCEVVITGTNCGFRDVVAFEVYNTELDPATQLCLAPNDTTSPGGGLREGRIILASEEAGPPGMIARTRDAWTYGLHQAIAWWSRPTSYSINSTSWTNPFDGQAFAVRGRQRKSASTVDHRARAYVWGDVTVTGYQWRLSSGTDVVTSGTLTNTTGAWASWLTGLAVDCANRDALTFEMRRTAGSGSVHVQRLSCCEEKV